MISRDDDIDPRVRALYGRSSTAEPPAVLDDAIRAAARRAVGSAPHAHPSTMRRAPGATRAWWSLAAAATVGAIAIGIVEMMPADERTPPATSRAPSAPPPVHSDPLPPKPSADTETAAGAVASSNSVALPAATAPRKSEGARGVVKPPVSAPAAPAARSQMPAREVQDQPEASERESSSPDRQSTSPAAALDTRTGANAKSLAAPQAFPAPPSAASPMPAPPIDAATPSRGAAQPMAKSRAAGAERATVASFDERVKAIQLLVQEQRYDEARRELVRLREDHPDRIDTIPPELRAWLSPR